MELVREGIWIVRLEILVGAQAGLFIVDIGLALGWWRGRLLLPRRFSFRLLRILLLLLVPLLEFGLRHLFIRFIAEKIHANGACFLIFTGLSS